MRLVFGLLITCGLLSVFAQTPDATTSITCNNPLRVVEIGSVLGTECTVRAMAAGQVVSVPFSAFGFSVSDNNGELVNINPLDGSSNPQFTFQIQAGAVTGPFVLKNTIGAPVINFTVVSIPGPLSELSCLLKQPVSEICECTVVPRDASNARVWVEANKFSFSGLAKGGIAMTWTPPTEATGNFFEWRGSFPSSAVFTVSNGVSSKTVQVAALGTHDSTSVIRCEPNVVPVDTITICTLEAMNNSQSVTIEGTPGINFKGFNDGASFSIQSEDFPGLSVGSRFTITANAGPTRLQKPSANTGVFNLTDGVAPPFPVTVIVDPDQSSILSCESTSIVAGGSLSCTSTPQLLGKSVYSGASLWQLSATDKSGTSGDAIASFSSIVPSTAGNLFHWSVSPSESLLGEMILNDGKSPKLTINVTAPMTPDITTSMSCASTLIRPSQKVSCTILPKAANIAIPSSSRAFVLSDTQDGTFSSITPAAGTVLMFSYTPKSTASGTVTISNGVGPKVTITVSNTAPTMPSPTSPTAPTTRPPTAAVDEGGLGTGGVVVLVLSIIIVIFAVFLSWAYRKKMQAGKVDPMETSMYSPPAPV